MRRYTALPRTGKSCTSISGKKPLECILAPCALSHVTYGAPNDLGIEYIEEKARGGVAQITQGNITGPGGYGDNGGHFNRYFTNCFTDMAFTELATAIKEHGAVPSAEINHAGFMAGLAENSNTPPNKRPGS